MRRLLLILLTITILIGLPRLADKFREDRISQKGKPTGTSPLDIAQQNPSKTESGPSLPAGVNSGAPSAAAQAIPVSLKTSDVQTSSKAEAQRAGPASLPASEDELISAIQKELIRIGYYAGPITGKWSKASRAAARSFARQANRHARHPKPTLKLLSTLQAAQPGGKREAGRDSSELHLQSAEPAVSGEGVTVKPPVESTRVGMQSDGYLPPWEKNGTAPQHISAKSEVVLRPASGLPVPAITERDTNEVPAVETRKPSKRVTHKRHRLARAARERRRYSSYRGPATPVRRRVFGSGNFGWPGL
jgi:hypothetical protein